MRTRDLRSSEPTGLATIRVSRPRTWRRDPWSSQCPHPHFGVSDRRPPRSTTRSSCLAGPSGVSRRPRSELQEVPDPPIAVSHHALLSHVVRPKSRPPSISSSSSAGSGGNAGFEGITSLRPTYGPASGSGQRPLAGSRCHWVPGRRAQADAPPECDRGCRRIRHSGSSSEW